MSQVQRVLLCCENYLPSVGGVQEVMRQIAERLVVNGLDVTVATSIHPHRPLETVLNGVRVRSFAITGNRVIGIRGALLDYQRFLMQGDFDAVLIKAAQQWSFDAALEVLTNLRARKLFIPCGFSGLHDPRYADYFAEMPSWLALFDGLIFYSGDYQDIAFARAHGLSALHVLPNGVDEREFLSPDDHGIRARLGIPEEHDLLLTVGSVLAAKGHWEVLRAFVRASLDRPTTLIINGNDPGYGLTRVKRLIKHLLSGRWPLQFEGCWHGFRNAGLSRKNIRVLDLPRSELVDLYKAADLFVFASHVEYSPLVLFEAVAAGLPFLSSSAGNSSEIARWTQAGYIMSASNTINAQVSVSELSQQMENMLRERSRWQQLGQSGRAVILSGGFTWDRIVQRYQELILGLNS